MDAAQQMQELQKTIDSDDSDGMVRQRDASRATAKSKQGAGREASNQKIKLMKVNVELNNGQQAQVNRLPAPRNTEKTQDGA